jgi:hypothetical protein
VDRRRRWSGDGGVGAEHGAVVVEDGGIADVGVDEAICTLLCPKTLMIVWSRAPRSANWVPTV